MKLTEPEIVALLDLHAGNIVDAACEGDVAYVHRVVARIIELVDMLPKHEAEELRTVQ